MSSEPDPPLGSQFTRPRTWTARRPTVITQSPTWESQPFGDYETPTSSDKPNDGSYLVIRLSRTSNCRRPPLYNPVRPCWTKTTEPSQPERLSRAALSEERKQLLQCGLDELEGRTSFVPPPFISRSPAASCLPEWPVSCLLRKAVSVSAGSDSAMAVARNPRGARVTPLDKSSTGRSATASPDGVPKRSSVVSEFVEFIRFGLKRRPGPRAERPDDLVRADHTAGTDGTSISAAHVRHTTRMFREAYRLSITVTGVEPGGDRTASNHCRHVPCNSCTDDDANTLTSQEALKGVDLEPSFTFFVDDSACFEPGKSIWNSYGTAIPVFYCNQKNDQKKEETALEHLVEEIFGGGIGDLMAALDIFFLAGRVLLGGLSDWENIARDPDPGWLRETTMLQRV